MENTNAFLPLGSDPVSESREQYETPEIEELGYFQICTRSSYDVTG